MIAEPNVRPTTSTLTKSASQSVADLQPTYSGIVAHFTDDRLGSKLMAMGLREGSTVAVIQKAPFGSGLYLKVDSTHFIAVRKEEAACIMLT